MLHLKLLIHTLVHVLDLFYPYHFYMYMCMYMYMSHACLQVVVYKNPSKLDLEASELSIGATVERLKAIVLFRFLNRVKVNIVTHYTHVPAAYYVCTCSPIIVSRKAC